MQAVQINGTNEMVAFIHKPDGKKLTGRQVQLINHISFGNISPEESENLLLSTEANEAFICDILVSNNSFQLCVNHRGNDNFNTITTGVGVTGNSMVSIFESSKNRYEKLYMPPSCQLFIKVDEVSQVFLSYEEYYCVSFEAR